MRYILCFDLCAEVGVRARVRVRVRVRGRVRVRIRVRVRVRVRVETSEVPVVRWGLLSTTLHSIFYSRVDPIAIFRHC